MSGEFSEEGTGYKRAISPSSICKVVFGTYRFWVCRERGNRHRKVPTSFRGCDNPTRATRRIARLCPVKYGTLCECCLRISSLFGLHCSLAFDTTNGFLYCFFNICVSIHHLCRRQSCPRVHSIVYRLLSISSPYSRVTYRPKELGLVVELPSR